VYAPFGTATCLRASDTQIEWEAGRATDLLQRFAEHCLQPRFMHHHTHVPGDLLLYDNWQTAHRSSPEQRAATKESEIRCMYRISCKGFR
jgi:alpha-ketoglutarate-dependent taurine dioxygenase